MFKNFEFSIEENGAQSLVHINDALDEIGIPRETKVGVPYTTWGRVAILIDRCKDKLPESEQGT